MADDSMVSITYGYGRVIVSVDCKKIFDGTTKELREVLERHTRQMDYIDSHDGDGRELR